MVEISHPTSHLPPIKYLSVEDFEKINSSIDYLHSIYNPEVRGSRRRKLPQKRDPVDGNTNKVALRVEALRSLRADSFERAFAIRWLTALIAHLDGDKFALVTTRGKEQIIQDAASLLAMCSGSSGAGVITRNFTFDYRPPRGDRGKSPIPINVKITDIPLDNDDFRSVGAQTWGGAHVLSEIIVEDPERFNIGSEQFKQPDAFRILELGAGTGLVSLTIWKLIEEAGLHRSRRVEILATDYYPAVLDNLRTNIDQNVREGLNSSVSISAAPLDWSYFSLNEARDIPLGPPFDLILGADIVYEPEHVKWIHSCVTSLMRRSLDHTDIEQSFFHLVIPLRSTHSIEPAGVEAIFRAEMNSPSPSLQIMAKDTVICDTEEGEEVEYAYYKIGWVEK